MPLFDALAEKLAGAGLNLQVAHAGPRGAQAERHDAARGDWSVEIKSHSMRLGRQDLFVRDIWSITRRSEVVVAELASTNLDTFALASLRPSNLILWGHGRSYVNSANAIDNVLERWLAKRAAHVLLYTDAGREHLRRCGVTDSRMSVLRNSTDTRALRREAAGLSSAEVGAFRAEMGSVDGSTAVFVGALDESKRLPLLLAASALIRAKIPNFRLLVAGDGPLRTYLTREAVDHPEVAVLPRADRRRLALLGAVGDLCVMPGRVGLVAVDAMTLGLPVVTTDFAFHAPERDYLAPGFSWVTAHDPVSYAARVADLLGAPSVLQAASRAAAEASLGYSIEYMAEQMCSSIMDVRRARRGA